MDITSTASTPLRLAVVIGSSREGRFGTVVANWFTERARQREDLHTDVIDLAEAELPTTMSSRPGPEATRALSVITPLLEAADAYVVITPEYNHSYPATLKNAIDWHSAPWRAKPVGFVSYGGVSGGLRAVEHLRLVFAELHTVTVRDTVSFHNAWDRFDDEGRPLDVEGANGAAKTMLDQLAWWARALREARTVRPYGN